MLILLLDDNADILKLVSILLNRAANVDCRILSGRDGEEGLQLLNTSEKTPDLIITNLRMPRIDGLAFLRQVRQREDWSGIPAVLMSANLPSSLQAEASTVGVDAFLAKPFNFDQLKATLESFGLS